MRAALSPRASAEGPFRRHRRRQGLGGDGQGGRGSLVRSARRAGDHPLRLFRALRKDRDRRGSAPGAGQGRADGGPTHVRLRLRSLRGRFRPLPNLGRRFRADAIAAPRHHPCRQAVGQRRAPEVRRHDFGDELPEAPYFGDQGRSAGGGLSSGTIADPDDLGRAGRRSHRHRLRPDGRRPDDFRRRPWRLCTATGSTCRKR